MSSSEFSSFLLCSPRVSSATKDWECQMNKWHGSALGEACSHALGFSSGCTMGLPGELFKCTDTQTPLPERFRRTCLEWGLASLLCKSSSDDCNVHPGLTASYPVGDTVIGSWHPQWLTRVTQRCVQAAWKFSVHEICIIQLVAHSGLHADPPHRLPHASLVSAPGFSRRTRAIRKNKHKGIHFIYCEWLWSKVRMFVWKKNGGRYPSSIRYQINTLKYCNCWNKVSLS